MYRKETWVSNSIFYISVTSCIENTIILSITEHSKQENFVPLNADYNPSHFWKRIWMTTMIETIVCYVTFLVH